MTVHDNVGVRPERAQAPQGTRSASASRELLELVRLDGLGRPLPVQLSGGQLQRMALARALAVQPRCCCSTSRSARSTPRCARELREWLRRLHEEIHVTTIFVTHDQEEAMEVAEQIVVMNEGRIEQAGAPRELYESPRNEFVMSFIGPVNRLGDAFVRPHDIQILPEARRRRATEALVERVVHLGFEVRVELTLADGREIWAQVTRESAQQLELEEGQILSVRAARAAGVRSPDPLGVVRATLGFSGRAAGPSGSARPPLRA